VKRGVAGNIGGDRRLLPPAKTRDLTGATAQPKDSTTHPVTLHGALADALMTVTFRRFNNQRYIEWSDRCRREYARELNEERWVKLHGPRPEPPPPPPPQFLPPASTAAEWFEQKSAPAGQG